MKVNVERLKKVLLPKENTSQKIGIEIEVIPIKRGKKTRAVNFWEKGGVAEIMDFLSARRRWSVIKEESGHKISLKRNGCRITLEPGGIIELSTPPCDLMAEIEEHIQCFYLDLSAVEDQFDVGFLWKGIVPNDTAEDLPLIPGFRYSFMDSYMPKVGSHGRDMMRLTASIQVSVDYSDEKDLALKYRTATLLGPLFVALSANSRIYRGKDSGYESYRIKIWEGTDPARTGFPPFALDSNDPLTDYTEWALGVPIYFLNNGVKNVTFNGEDFRTLIERFDDIGTPRGLDRELLYSDYWRAHLTTLFPWVRLRGYMELRYFDSVGGGLELALPALIKGIFYDKSVLEDIRDYLTERYESRFEEAFECAARYGLSGEVGGLSFKSDAERIISHAELSLSKEGEASYLNFFNTQKATQNLR